MNPSSAPTLTPPEGGTPEGQKDFVESLSPGVSTRRTSKVPPVANAYALGYTYQDVLDAEDGLAPHLPATAEPD